MVTNHVDVAVVRVLIEDEINVIRTRTKLDVVAGEVATGLQVIVNDLFEDVFLHSRKPI